MRNLPRLLRALFAQPGRQAARRGWLAARDQARRLPHAGAPRTLRVRMGSDQLEALGRVLLDLAEERRLHGDV